MDNMSLSGKHISDSTVIRFPKSQWTFNSQQWVKGLTAESHRSKAKKKNYQEKADKILGDSKVGPFGLEAKSLAFLMNTKSITLE